MSTDRRQLPGISGPLEGRGEADRQPRVSAVRADVLVAPDQPSVGGRRRALEVLDVEGDVDVLRALEEILVVPLLAAGQSGIHPTNSGDVARLDGAGVGFD